MFSKLKMRQNTNSHWICYAIILASVFALPARGWGEGLSSRGARRQEMLSPEMVQELASIYYERARTYYRKGDYLKARIEFEEVLNFEPGHQGALWYLNFISKELGISKKTGRPVTDKLKQEARQWQKAQDRSEDRKKRTAKKEKKAKKKKVKKTKIKKTKEDTVTACKLKELEKDKERLESTLEEYRNKNDRVKKDREATTYRVRQLQREKERLEATLRDYKSQDDGVAKEARINARKLKQLQKEKKRLERNLEKYKEAEAKHQDKIERIQQKLEDEKTARLKRAKTEKDNLTAELNKLRREQQAQLEKELSQYEQSLKESFAEKIKGYNEKIADYEKTLKENEDKIKRLEDTSRQLSKRQDETQKLARIEADISKETAAFKEEEEANHQLKEKLAALRSNQEAELKRQLQQYEEAFQERLSRKEAELDEKIRLYDTKIRDLQVQSPPPQAVQKVDYADTGLLGLQMKANEELRMQLGVFKREKAQPFYEEGMKYVAAKKYAQARTSFQKALSIYSDYAEVKEALKDIEKQDKIILLLSEGEYYYKEENHLKALEYFNQVLDLDYKNKEARDYLHRIEEYVKQKERLKVLAREKEQARLKKEEQARLKAEAEARRQEQARLREEEERKAKEAKLARIKAEKEEELRLKREAEARRREQARLREEEERKAKEAKLARIKAEKEEQARLKREAEARRREQARIREEEERKAKEAELARIKAKKEEQARLKAEAEARRREQARIREEEERKAKEAELARIKAKKEEQARLKAEAEARRREQARIREEEERKAKEAKLARIKAEKEEELRLKREAEVRRREQARIKEEKERKEREAKLARLKAEKEERIARLKAEKEAEIKRVAEQKEQKEKIEFHLSQGKYYYKEGNNLKAIEHFNQILALDYKHKDANRYLHSIEQNVKERKRIEALALQKEQARQKEEEERKAKEAKLARIKAEKEEQARLKAEAEAQRREQARIREEEERKAKEAKRARIKAEKEERIARIKAEKQEKLRLKQEAKAQRREQAQLKKEEERKAKEAKRARIKAEKEAKLARLKEEKEERLRLKREAEARSQEEARLREEKEAEERAIREAERAMIEQARIKACEEKLDLQKAEEKKKKEELQKKIDMHYARGKEHFENRNYIAARKEFKDILMLDLGNQYAINALEKVDATIAREEKELNALERKKKEEEQAAIRSKIKHHLAQGKVYFYQENYHDAIDEFSKILFVEPSNKAAEKYIQRAKKKLTKYRRREHTPATAREEKAEDVRLEKLTRRQRKVEKNAIKKAQRLLSRQKKPEMDRFEEVEEVEPENEEQEKIAKIKKLYEKGKVYFQEGQYLESVACFEKVIELEGNPAIYYTPQAKDFIERARTEMEEKKKEDAEKIAEDELEFRKEQKERIVHDHYKRGRTYYRQGNYPMAIAEFNKVSEMDPQHRDVDSAEQYIQKCRLKIMQSQEAEVRAEMRKEGVIQEGVSSDSLLKQAQWYYKRGDYEQAAKVARAALELDYLNKKALNLLHRAELKQTKKDHKQAYKEVSIDEKAMMAEVAELQVLPLDETVQVPEKDIIPIVKVPIIREKLKSPLTVDFRDVDLTYVLDFLADSTGVNIIAASGVSLEGKKVTIRIKDMPAENALKYILKNQGLTYRVEENAIWVASPGEMEKEEVESRVYFLNRGSGMFTEFERTVGTGTGLGGSAAISKVTTIKDILEEAVDWPKNSKLVLDDRSGALVISNIPSNLQIIEEILYNLDITPVQVLIETRFIELEVTDVEQLGIEWQITEAYGDRRNEDKDNITQFEDTAGWDFSSFTSYATEGMNLTYSGVLTYPQFQSVLHALSRTQNAKTLSSPRISTLNNQMATIKVVDEWIYPTRYEFQVVQSDVNGDGDFDDANETIYQNVPVDFVTKDVGILLHVTPSVGGDGKTVTLALVPEVSEGTAGAFSYTGSVSLPKFTSRTLSTSVVINNGETVALGGLVKETTTKTVTKVPLIGDIPFLGALFRKKSDSIVRKNLLIFVTATILTPDGERIETVQYE